MGDYADSSGHEHGFLDSGGVYTTLDFPGSIGTFAQAINDSGQIVGWYGSGSSSHGFLDSGGVYTLIDFPGSTSTFAQFINDSGQIAGNYDDSGGQVHGFLYSGGAYTTLNFPGTQGGTVVDGINASGQIVGVYTDSSGQHGFLDSGGVYTTIDFPGSTYINGLAINDAGQIAGSAEGGGSTQIYDFLYSGGAYTLIDLPGSAGGEALSINDSGEIVGSYIGNNQIHGFLAITNPTANPTANPDRTHVQFHGAVTAAAPGVLANDIDPIPGDHLIVSAVDDQTGNVGIPITGAYGTLTLNADGSFSYSETGALPASGVGLDVFNYSASTGQGGTATSTLTVVDTAAGYNYIALPSTSTGNLGMIGGNGPTVVDASQTQGVTFSVGNGPKAILAGTGDVIQAGNGPTTIYGAAGAALKAGNGPDTLYGAANEDLFGGSGPDTFVFTNQFGVNDVASFNPFIDNIQLAASVFHSFGAMETSGEI